MRNKRNPWIMVILLFVGAVAGGMLGEFLSQYPFFKWMSFGGVNGYRNLLAFSFNPLIDTRIVSFGLNFALRINAGGILGMIVAVIIFFRRSS